MTGSHLLQLLAARAEAGSPLRVGLIGAGKFGTMFLSQIRRVSGLHLLGVADLSPERARQALTRAEWPPEQFAAATFAEALKSGATFITDNSQALLEAAGLDVVVEATGVPGGGYSTRAARLCQRSSRGHGQC